MITLKNGEFLQSTADDALNYFSGQGSPLELRQMGVMPNPPGLYTIENGQIVKVNEVHTSELTIRIDDDGSIWFQS